MSPDWIKKKKAIINPKSEDDKCFQYTATVTLNYYEIKWNLDRISNIIPVINKYYWEETTYLSKLGDWKMFEKNNPVIAFKILYTKEKKYFQLLFQNITQPVKKQ